MHLGRFGLVVKLFIVRKSKQNAHEKSRNNFISCRPYYDFVYRFQSGHQEKSGGYRRCSNQPGRKDTYLLVANSGRSCGSSRTLNTRYGQEKNVINSDRNGLTKLRKGIATKFIIRIPTLSNVVKLSSTYSSLP